PLLVQVEEAVDVAGVAKRQVAVAQAELEAGPGQRGVGVQQQGDGRRHAGAVDALVTVDEHRVLGLVGDGDQLSDGADGGEAARGAAVEVFQRDVVAGSDAALVEVPGLVLTAAAQVDDGADVVAAGDAVQLGGRRLRATVDGAGDDLVEV